MRRVLWILLFFCCLFLCGCKKDQPLLFFNSQPITSQTINHPGRNFSANQPIYYILIVPKGFKNDYIRAQIVKKDEKTAHWGYKIYQSKDFRIDRTKNYFINSFVLNEPGYYFMQIFPFNNFDVPIARNDFWVR